MKLTAKTLTTAGVIISLIIALSTFARGYFWKEYELDQLRKDYIILERKVEKNEADIKYTDAGVLKNEIEHINEELKNQKDFNRELNEKLDNITSLIIQLSRDWSD